MRMPDVATLTSQISEGGDVLPPMDDSDMDVEVSDHEGPGSVTTLALIPNIKHVRGEEENSELLTTWWQQRATGHAGDELIAETMNFFLKALGIDDCAAIMSLRGDEMNSDVESDSESPASKRQRNETLKDKERNEPLLVKSKERWSLYPVRYPRLWELYKVHIRRFWTVDEVDLAQDMRDWERLSGNEKRFIKRVLAYFAASDAIVMENVAANFQDEVQAAEARCYYAFQNAMEACHTEMYALMLEAFVPEPDERIELFRSVERIDSIKEKANWAEKWMNRERSFYERLIAFACVEGIHFQASFAAIFWLKKRGLMPGLAFSNELTSKDEMLHTTFACELYKAMKYKLPKDVVHKIIKEAVEVEKQFVIDALPVRLLGMNQDLMIQYVACVADALAVGLGYDRIYGTENPFPFMELLDMEGKTNFFEKRVGEYQKSNVPRNEVFLTQRYFDIDHCESDDGEDTKCQAGISNEPCLSCSC